MRQSMASVPIYLATRRALFIQRGSGGECGAGLVASGLMQLDPRLGQDEILDGDMPLAQQVQGAAPIVLLGQGARLVTHDLRDHANWAFGPLRQGAEGSPESMQGQGG